MSAATTRIPVGAASARALTAWGDAAPDWVLALAAEADRGTARAAALSIGYSAATVSLVLANRYTGDLTAVEQVVRGRLMALTVPCPVVGDLAADTCLFHQRQPWAPHNPQRIQFYRACRSGCAHSRLAEGREGTRKQEGPA
jgi:hypothetical protein